MPKKGYKPTEEHRKYLRENHSRYWLGKKRPNLWNGCRIDLVGTELNKNHKQKISETNKKRMQLITHHINGNHNDDRPENKVNITQSEHIKLHINQGDVHPWTGRW